MNNLNKTKISIIFYACVQNSNRSDIWKWVKFELQDLTLTNKYTEKQS